MAGGGGCERLLGALVCEGRMGVNAVAHRGVVVDPSLDPGVEASAVLVTHGHWDHFSAAPLLRGRGARVYAPRLCRGFVEEPRLYWMVTLCWAGPVEERVVTRYFTGGGVAVDAVAEPGRVLPGVEAVEAPGHTPGSMVYILEAPGGRLLAAGDTVYGWSYLERSPFLYHVDSVAWLSTLERLRGLDVDALVPGHGEPVEGREARRLVEANMGKLRDMLGLVERLLPGPLEEPVYADEVAARLAEATGYQSSRRVYSILCPTVRALLRGLAALGRAEELMVRGVPAWRRRG